MTTIRGRKEVIPLITLLQQQWLISKDDFYAGLQVHILDQRISFPLLEYISEHLMKFIPGPEQIAVVSKILDMRGTGRYVLAGQMMRRKIDDDLLGTLTSTFGFIRKANEWRACDLMGERVIGSGLLSYPQETLSLMEALTISPMQWDLRAIGVGIHHAVKKGLPKEHTKNAFEILLSLATVRENQTKKGIGWAAKTIARYYPDLIHTQMQRLNDPQLCRHWFRSRIKAGLLKAETT